MKKTVSVALALVFLLGLCVSGALAYDYNDDTLVQEWNAGHTYGGGAWKDVIGTTTIFDTLGADWNGSLLTIYTKWNPNTMDPDISSVKTADLFIDAGCNGSWDYAIVLDVTRTTEVGKAYVAPFSSVSTSDDLFKGQTSLIYGGLYDETAPSVAVALASSGSTLNADVNWTIGSGGHDNYVTVDLSNLGLTEPFGFYWGTGTCSNDGFAACVPIPPSMLLMGSGLLGVGLLGWRRRGSENEIV